MVRATKSLHVVPFECGGQMYCFDSAGVVDVIPASRMQRHDDLPKNAVGAVTDGAARHSVYSLAQQLGQANTTLVSDDDEVILVQSSRHVWGLLVNRVFSGEALGNAQVAPMPQLLRSAPAESVRIRSVLE